ncbi:MAG: type I-B CRISPR-associated endonuclease Cas1b [Candidatus Woesearchaeota archaeon]
MKQNLYIIKSGKIRRKSNTLYFENKKEKKYFPINDIESIYCFGEVSINTKLLKFLSKLGIIIHFFNNYGYYIGSFYPKESLVSGILIVNQVEHYLDIKKRIFLAKEIINSVSFNLIKVLEHYKKHNKPVDVFIEKIRKLREEIEKVDTIESIMNIEGRIWQTFYSSYEVIIENFEFEERSKRPPKNEINCLISFLNSLLYTTTLSQIYKTQLNPTISYLHEPFERRFSLALDLSEMFKPLIVQKSILKLINKKEIKENHFRKDLKRCILNENGKKLVLKEFDERLKEKVMHPKLNRIVSYKTLLLLDCYKLIKHLINEKEYQGFKIWW